MALSVTSFSSALSIGAGEAACCIWDSGVFEGVIMFPSASPMRRASSSCFARDVGPAACALSIHRTKGHEIDGGVGDGHDLEELAHPAFAGAGEPVDRGLDDLLGLRLAVAAEGGCAFEDA